MIVLQGIWATSQLHIWGEDSFLLSSRKGGTSTARKRPTLHPFALSQKGLHQKERSGMLTFLLRGKGKEGLMSASMASKR